MFFVKLCLQVVEFYNLKLFLGDGLDPGEKTQLLAVSDHSPRTKCIDYKSQVEKSRKAKANMERNPI